jgi:flagellar hook-length control protein FliK
VSNLNVSYVSQTPAGTPAGTPAAAAQATGNPLGFLGALLDQLLAGGTEAIQATATGEASAAIDVPGLLGAALATKAEAPAGKPALPAGLLDALIAKLDQLQSRIESGGAPAGDELPGITQAIDALVSAIDARLAPPAPSTGAVPAGSTSTAPTSSAPATPAISLEQITQLLTDLGLVEPPQTKPGNAGKPTGDGVVVAKPATDIMALRDRLTALAQSVAATDPDLAQKLNTLVMKLEPAATDPALAAELGLAAPPPDPDPDALAIAHIIRALLGHGDKPETPALPTDIPAAAPTPTPAENPAPQVHDDLLQILASLGLNTPPTATPSATAESVEPPTTAVTTTTGVPQPLLRLSTQLSQVATELATTAPELAKKLEALATRLVSVDADANLNGKITSAAAQSDGTALNKLVQSLLDAKPVITPAPAAAPQIAAPQELPVPAPIAPKQSKSAVAEVKAAPPVSAPATADSAPQSTPRVALAATAEATIDRAPGPKVEAKAAIVADASKADVPDQPAQPQPQAAPAAAQQARPLPVAYQPVANPINMGQVAFEMVRQVNQGTSRFTIRLDPPELGRVDVKMHVDNTGTVNARLTVDRAETLDLFQRDRQSLERALSQAGLDTTKTNLEFSLRQQNHNPFAGMMGGDQRQNQSGHGNASHFAGTGSDEAAMPAITLYRGTASAGGVNIFA